uniref:Uncharacterized protein n=1 Tax=Glossina austeni TaxID=7395 RepID=A0A1A9UYJ4_GLOAU
MKKNIDSNSSDRSKKGVFVIDIKIQIKDHNLSKRSNEKRTKYFNCEIREIRDNSDRPTSSHRAAVGDRPRDPETLNIRGDRVICPSLSPEPSLASGPDNFIELRLMVGRATLLTLEWDWCVTHISWPPIPSQQRGDHPAHGFIENRKPGVSRTEGRIENSSDSVLK